MPKSPRMRNSLSLGRIWRSPSPWHFTIVYASTIVWCLPNHEWLPNYMSRSLNQRKWPPVSRKDCRNVCHDDHIRWINFLPYNNDYWIVCIHSEHRNCFSTLGEAPNKTQCFSATDNRIMCNPKEQWLPCSLKGSTTPPLSLIAIHLKWGDVLSNDWRITCNDCQIIYQNCRIICIHGKLELPPCSWWKSLVIRHK